MLDIQPGLMIYTLITFGVLLFILKRYAFGPIQTIIDQRRNQIETTIRHAEEAKAENERLLAEYRESIAQAKHEAEDIIERAKKVGDSTKAEIMAQAKEQAQKEVSDARDQIQREARKAIQGIKNEVADLTVLAAGKVVGKSLSKEDHLRLVDEALTEAEFDQLGAGGV